jgi:hypothetical protein
LNVAAGVCVPRAAAGSSGYINQAEAMTVTEFDANPVANRGNDKRLSAQAEQVIARAVARIEYGSIEVVIHDGQVVQIERREKIRAICDRPGRKNAMRQIR